MRVSDVKPSDPRLTAERYKYIIASISDPSTQWLLVRLVKS